MSRCVGAVADREGGDTEAGTETRELGAVQTFDTPAPTVPDIRACHVRVVAGARHDASGSR